MLICPAGPPKLMKPSFSQYSKASRKETGPGRWSGLVFTIRVKVFIYTTVANLCTDRISLDQDSSRRLTISQLMLSKKASIYRAAAAP